MDIASYAAAQVCPGTIEDEKFIFQNRAARRAAELMRRMLSDLAAKKCERSTRHCEKLEGVPMKFIGA